MISFEKNKVRTAYFTSLNRTMFPASFYHLLLAGLLLSSCNKEEGVLKIRQPAADLRYPLRSNRTS